MNNATLPIQPEQALLELTLLNSEERDREFDDVVVAGLGRGVPAEILTRLEQLWNQTKVIAGEVVAIGKIIVAKIIEFLKAHPKLAIGAALGAAVGCLIGAVPFIGALLQPLAMAVGAIFGAGVGASEDAGRRSNSLLTAATELARAFLELFVSILNGVAVYWEKS